MTIKNVIAHMYANVGYMPKELMAAMLCDSTLSQASTKCLYIHLRHDFPRDSPPLLAPVIGCLASFFLGPGPIPGDGSGRVNFQRKARDLPKSMIELCEGDANRVERMLQIFSYLRLKYESQILDKYVYDTNPSGLHDDDDPWPEYLEILLKHHPHKETLGAFNNTLPTEEFATDWMNKSQTLESLMKEALGTTSISTKSWMFENPHYEVRKMCQETHLDFPQWMESVVEDGEYIKNLRDQEDRMRKLADALFHHQRQEAFLLTPPHVFINWGETQKAILDVNYA